MKRQAFRIVKTKYVSSAFDGEGARLYGGRWNSMGTRMVYVASSLSLATLELLVHLEDLSTIKDIYSVIPVEFDSSLAKIVAPADLPRGWDAPEPISATQEMGDQWVTSNASIILEIPSAVTATETNFLLNPQHPNFNKVVQGIAFPFSLDTRLT